MLSAYSHASACGSNYSMYTVPMDVSRAIAPRAMDPSECGFTQANYTVPSAIPASDND